MITVSDALENAKRIGGKTGLNCIAGLIETKDIEQISAESEADGHPLRNRRMPALCSGACDRGTDEPVTNL